MHAPRPFYVPSEIFIKVGNSTITFIISPNHSLDISQISQSDITIKPDFFNYSYYFSNINSILKLTSLPCLILFSLPKPFRPFSHILIANYSSGFKTSYFLHKCILQFCTLTSVNMHSYHYLAYTKHLRLMIKLYMTISYIGLRLYTLQYTRFKQYLT